MIIHASDGQSRWQRWRGRLFQALRLRRRSSILQAPEEICILSLNRMDRKFKSLRLLKAAQGHP